ncbi:hypothetical protein VE25_20595 [Devosia geojensis]|uniref:Uncharacterized protein n=1 Tax=Devosia geojensis TaxID=443610 RepID=A0A0F5FE62_9HYPH|nr:hypothetical protein [Devosia geojensis]KKB06875.1 hypothetical protein VE25_20595 [Devosia geojensis]
MHASRPAVSVLLAALLVAAPAAAQEKTKSKAPARPITVELLETCELFARGDVLASSSATEKGWSVTEAVTDSVFVSSFEASRSFEGIGDADLFVLVEDYPQLTLGYCRIDISEPQGEAGVAELDGLDRLAGDLEENADGTYGAWNGTGEDASYMLLSNQDEYSFGLQLTIIEPVEGGQ